MWKRCFDIATTIFLFLILSIPGVLLALAVRWTLGKPVFFKQLRPGRLGKPFCLFKFRTMTSTRDSAGDFLPDEFRLTRFGRFLRSTSLDELPGLWNVLSGDMSLVGPRPLLMEYLEVYTDIQMRRMEVRPGITGWAQINGRNAITWEEKFELDIWYVDNQSWKLDMRILWRTFWYVLKRTEINHDLTGTMPVYAGPDNQDG